MNGPKKVTIAIEEAIANQICKQSNVCLFVCWAMRAGEKRLSVEGGAADSGYG